MDFKVDTFKHRQLSIEGLSLSGIRTAFSVSPWSLGFDVGPGFPFSFNLKNIFISHAHMDHAAGIPYIISQKAMNRQPQAQFYLPSSQCDGLTRIIKIWEELEGHTYNYKFTPVENKFEFEINKNIFVKSFSTVHRIESYGYSIIEKTQKLKHEFKNTSESEIIQLKKQGIQIHQTIEKILFSFTGDTQIEFMDVSPQALESEVLFLETTYLDDKKSIEHAKTWGHTHLDELIPRLHEIKSEKIVLIHTSSRYSFKELQTLIKEKIPKNHQDRVCLFQGR